MEGNLYYYYKAVSNDEAGGMKIVINVTTNSKWAIAEKYIQCG